MSESGAKKRRSPTLPDGWQPWQLPDFAAPALPVIAEAEEVLSSLTAQPPNDDNAELERLRQEARLQGLQSGQQQGHQQGYDAGFQQGLEEGRERGRQQFLEEQQPLLDQWLSLTREFQISLQGLDHVIAARLMQLALSAARQIIGQSPVCDASTIMRQIQTMIQQEPLFSGNLQLRVNPQDLTVIQAQIGPQLEKQGWRLLADPLLHRGGCKISAEEGDLDASLATRWQELCKLAAPEMPT